MCQKKTGSCPTGNPFERSLKRFLLRNLGEVEDKRCQLFEPQGQGNVKVQGMGIFFLVMPLAQTWHAKHQYKELTYEIL